MADRKPGSTSVLDRPASRNDRRDEPPPEKTDNKAAIKTAQKQARARLQEAVQKMDVSTELQNEAMEVMREVEESIGRNPSRAFVEKAIIGAQSYLSRKAQAEHDQKAKEKKYEEDKAKQETEEKEKKQKEEEAKEHAAPHGAVEEPESAKKDEQATAAEQSQDTGTPSTETAQPSAEQTSSAAPTAESNQQPTPSATTTETNQQQTEKPASADSSPVVNSSAEGKVTNSTEQHVQNHGDSGQKAVDKKSERTSDDHASKEMGKQEDKQRKAGTNKNAVVSQQRTQGKSTSSANAVASKSETASPTRQSGSPKVASHHVGGSVPVHAGGQRPSRGNNKNTGPGRTTPRSNKNALPSKAGPRSRPSAGSGRIRTRKIPPRPRPPMPRYNNPNVVYSGGGATHSSVDESFTHTTTSEETTDITVHEQQIESDSTITTPIGGGFIGGAGAGSGGGGSASSNASEGGQGNSGGVDGGAENGGRGSGKKKNDKQSSSGHGVGGANRLAQKLGFGKSGGKAGAKVAAQGGEKVVAQAAVRGGAVALFSNPVVLGILAAIVFIIIVIVIIVSIFGGKKGTEQQTTASPLTLQKTGPATAAMGQELTYTITAKYAGRAQDVVITDPLPVGTDYVSSTPPGVYDIVQRKVTWTASQLYVPLTNPISMPVTLVLRSTQDNLNVINKATATVIGGFPEGAGGGAPQEGYVPPNAIDCGGKYRALMDKNRFLKTNFGDPGCTPNIKEEIDKRFREKDPANADWWFQVAKCESGYGPNTWRDPDTVTHTPDAGGAWGLVQTGSSIIAEPESLYTNSKGRGSVQLENLKQLPGLPGGTWGHGGEFDRGDVNWEKQVDNAIELFKKRGKGYWACA